MLRKRLVKLLRDEDALTTVEFVALFPFLLVIVFFALEVGIALFWWQTIEEAAELGARLAVVSDPAVTGMPSTNALSSSNSNAFFGGRCSDSPSNCGSFTTLSCAGGSGGSCDSTAFTYIYTRMHNLFPPIAASNVTISYAYSGLGFAGGPTIPTVSVTVSGVPFNVSVPILPNVVSTVPDMTVMLTGECLNTDASC